MRGRRFWIWAVLVAAIAAIGCNARGRPHTDAALGSVERQVEFARAVSEDARSRRLLLAEVDTQLASLDVPGIMIPPPVLDALARTHERLAASTDALPPWDEADPNAWEHYQLRLARWRVWLMLSDAAVQIEDAVDRALACMDELDWALELPYATLLRADILYRVGRAEAAMADYFDVALVQYCFPNPARDSRLGRPFRARAILQIAQIYLEFGDAVYFLDTLDFAVCVEDWLTIPERGELNELLSLVAPR